uniref:Hydrolase_4 domain-containing protein n=1 Tax=Ascaris lumbricoides TaxID=6252 RepID=A0A0M3HQ27_ASCLU
MPPARCQLLLSFLPYVFAIFSDDFNAWLVKSFGANVQTQLNRADLDTMGSFGGKTDPAEEVRKDPVVFVHGVSDRAWDKPKYTGDFFKQGLLRFNCVSHSLTACCWKKS